ncbi:MAG: PspC domain-containing protein, partial [Alistipes sp.]|nr:PspC domain-containing protein [Alistipes sp.]
MKKIEKVSIANISFTLDNDAYASLRQYLDSLQNYYGNDPDGGEIIADIEARIAELILTEQVYTKTVAKSLVDTIVAQLGSPEQIDDEVGDIAVSGPEAAAGSKATANLDSGAAYSAYSDGVVSGSESAVGSNDAANSMNSEGGAAYSAYSDGVATGSNSAVADYDGAAAAEKPGTHDGASGVRQGGAPGGASGAEGSSDTHAEKQRGASGAERPSGTQSTEKSTPGRPAAQPDPSIPRRLHRSGERRVFGGVCGGMSRYFSIDVIWIRLAFLFPAICRILVAPIDNYFVDEFFEGWSWVFFVTYIVLWVALPMARTPRQKLEARGERITPESIRQNLQVAASTPSGRKAASVTAEMITVFGRIVLFFIRFIAATVGFSLLIAAMGIIVGMVFVATENGGILDMANVAWFANASSVVPVWFIEIVLLCVLLPIFAVGMALLSAVFGWRLRRAFFAVVLGLWACVMILTGAVAIGNAKHLKQQFSRENMYWFYDDHDYDYDFELDLDEGGWRWHEEIRRDDRHHHVV